MTEPDPRVPIVWQDREMGSAPTSFPGLRAIGQEESLEPGAIAGELAALDGRERSAAVRAGTPCRLPYIPAPGFPELVSTRHDDFLEPSWPQVDRAQATGDLRSLAAFDADSAARLFEANDANLYRATETGRDRVVADPG